MDGWASIDIMLLFFVVPAGVSNPELLNSGARFLHIGWKPPELPNGQLTGYYLFQDNIQVFFGGTLEVNITGLLVIV